MSLYLTSVPINSSCSTHWHPQVPELRPGHRRAHPERPLLPPPAVYLKIKKKKSHTQTESLKVQTQETGSGAKTPTCLMSWERNSLLNLTEGGNFLHSEWRHVYGKDKDCGKKFNVHTRMTGSGRSDSTWSRISEISWDDVSLCRCSSRDWRQSQ